MNEIVTKVLLAGNKFMPEMHLTQPRFTYNAQGPFAKTKERIQKFKETGYSRYIYQNELGKACLQLDMAYGDVKDLTRRTASNKILHDQAFNISKNPKYDGYQRGLSSMVYKFFHKTTFVKGNKNGNILKKELAKKLHKPIFRKFKNRKVQSPFKDNICSDDLVC